MSAGTLHTNPVLHIGQLIADHEDLVVEHDTVRNILYLRLTGRPRVLLSKIWEEFDETIGYKHDPKIDHIHPKLEENPRRIDCLQHQLCVQGIFPLDIPNFQYRLETKDFPKPRLVPKFSLGYDGIPDIPLMEGISPVFGNVKSKTLRTLYRRGMSVEDDLSSLFIAATKFDQKLALAIDPELEQKYGGPSRKGTLSQSLPMSSKQKNSLPEKFASWFVSKAERVPQILNNGLSIFMKIPGANPRDLQVLDDQIQLGRQVILPDYRARKIGQTNGSGPIDHSKIVALINSINVPGCSVSCRHRPDAKTQVLADELCLDTARKRLAHHAYDVIISMPLPNPS